MDPKSCGNYQKYANKRACEKRSLHGGDATRTLCGKVLSTEEKVKRSKGTYIHNWSLQHFSQDNWTQFLTPPMLYVLILYISGGTNSLKATPNYRFFKKLFMAILFYSQSFCQKSAEKIAEEILFVFRFDAWPTTRTLGFHLISQYTTYLLDHGGPSRTLYNLIYWPIIVIR